MKMFRAFSLSTRVVLSLLLSMLSCSFAFADPVLLWKTASLCAKPGAPVLIVDLVRPPDDEAVVRIVSEQAQDAPAILQRDFIASLRAAYSTDEVRQQLREAGLPGFHVDQVDELHFVAWGTAP